MCNSFDKQNCANVLPNDKTKLCNFYNESLNSIKCIF